MFSDKIEHVQTIEELSTDELVEMLREVNQSGNLDLGRLLAADDKILS